MPSSLTEGLLSFQPVGEQVLAHTYAVTSQGVLSLLVSELDANELVSRNEYLVQALVLRWQVLGQGHPPGHSRTGPAALLTVMKALLEVHLTHTLY